jgi:hypothetical protein
MVQAFLHPGELLAAEKANSKGVQGSADREPLIIRVSVVLAFVVMYLILVLFRMT